MKKMKEGMSKNIARKTPSISKVNTYKDFPLFSFIELNINEICNRKCPFCPRVNPEKYPNQNIHMSVGTAEKIAEQLVAIDFKGIVNISGTGEPLLTKYVPKIIEIFGSKGLHIEIVTNGDVLKRKKGTDLIKQMYSCGLSQLVVSMYDGPHQVEEFRNIFSSCQISDKYYSLRDRWYDESENYGLLYTNRAGNLKNDAKYSKNACYYTAYAMYVDYNGDVLLCCQDMYNRTVKFGNVHSENLIDIWHDKKLNEYRQLLIGGSRNLSPCNNCNANGRIFGKEHKVAWEELDDN
tara:strand:+ start:365 stop:1243 length:879 start_codon:yes stop_codon:yes gene_type:complete